MKPYPRLIIDHSPLISVVTHHQPLIIIDHLSPATIAARQGSGLRWSKPAGSHLPSRHLSCRAAKARSPPHSLTQNHFPNPSFMFHLVKSCRTAEYKKVTGTVWWHKAHRNNRGPEVRYSSVMISWCFCLAFRIVINYNLHTSHTQPMSLRLQHILYFKQ